jgi:hypothetical protein
MAPWKSKAGQIVFPAMLLFPTLFLFVYLIYETAKLSRDKIKHQFAMDAAAFVEATNYSDFLNRTAYVNGAFPMRIFEQGYDDFPFECEGKGDCSEFSPKMYAEVLYKNGVFPRSLSGTKLFTNEAKWDIAYGGAGVGRNTDPPTIPDPVVLFTHRNGDQSYHPWDLATEVYKLYFQVFSLLGSVENAQWEVLKRLTVDSNHSFLQKSYWLNTGDPAPYGTSLAESFNAALNFKTTPHCVRELVYHGNRYTGGAGLQQYHVGKTDPPIKLTEVVNQPGCSSGGLFQMQTVEKSSIIALRQGLSLTLPWQLPGKNYFNVDFGNRPQDFKNGFPELHTTVTVGASNPNASVWPDPTPKFQVRQYP